MTEKFACPRRAESYRPMVEEDTWKRGRGLVGQKRGCSYCGSMHPEDFLSLVREGYEVGPTDKSYKAYLSKSLTDEQKAEQKQKHIGYYVGQGMTEQEAREVIDSDPWCGMAHGEQVGKFYYQHLSEEQRDEFIRLYNAKQMKVSYPGYFYVMPFFCAIGKPKE